MRAAPSIATCVALFLLALPVLRAEEPGAAPKVDQKKPAFAGPRAIKLDKPKPPNAERKLQNGARDLSTLFVEFTPAGRKPIKAQVYITLAVPPEKFNTPGLRRPPVIGCRGHEVESFPENVEADFTLDEKLVEELSPSSYKLDLKDVKYQVYTTDKGKLPNQPGEEDKSVEKPKPIEKDQPVKEAGQAPRNP